MFDTDMADKIYGNVIAVDDQKVTLDVGDVNGGHRTFPKNLFDKNVKFGDEFSIVTTHGNGWMQVDIALKEKPLVTFDDDDILTDAKINEVIDSIAERDFIHKCRTYAIKCHNKVNQKYDGKPYKYHLDMAADFLYMFIDLVPKKDRANVIGGMYTHDTIEDTGITFNDLKKATNEKVANIAYALTNEKGKNRDERANSKYYRGIRKEEYADLDKLCDRLANVKHSYEKYKEQGKLLASMFDKYHSENNKFIWGLIKPEWYEIHQHLLFLLMGSKLYGRYRKSSYKYATVVMYLENMLNQK